MKKEEIIELKNKKRTLSRLVCAQILYQYHFFDEKRKIEQIKNDLLLNYVISESQKEKSYEKKVDLELIDRLTSGVLEQKQEIDEIILKLCKKSSEIDNLLMEILRLSAFEMKNMQDISKKIIANEYVNLTAMFFDDNKVSFVNSLIENLALEYDRK